jgi:hypothetical protein
MEIFEQRNKTTRSPLKAPPLRNPGQYLGEEIKRLQTEDIDSYIVVGMVFVFLLKKGDAEKNIIGTLLGS